MRIVRSRLFHIILLMMLVLLPLLSLSAQPAAAQCVRRTDWPVYVVQRGDTLSRIARRYGIPLYELAAANCLINLNLIYRGQRLYVPPTGVVITPPPMYPTTTGSVQYFEGGYMLWRSDIGTIYTLFNDGTLRAFPVTSYALLPATNAGIGITPMNRYRPVLGFGLVWMNNQDVRWMLGWATSPEFGVTISGMDWQTVSSRANGATLFTFNERSRIWSGGGSQPPPPTPYIPPPTPYIPPPTRPSTQNIAGTYQFFENGLMIYVANNGFIYALYSNGIAGSYSSGYYGNLPLNPIINPPPGRSSPIMGFGRLWGNDASVRSGLGWATTQEFSFEGHLISGLLTFQTGNTGIVALNTLNNTWYYASGGPPPYDAQGSPLFTPYPNYPTPYPTPTPNSVAIVTTRGAFQQFNGGFMVWRQDTGEVLVFLGSGSGTYYRYTEPFISTLPINSVTDPVPPGYVMPVNAFGRIWAYSWYPNSQLGWALTPEIGYDIQYESYSDGSQSLNLSNGARIRLTDQFYWSS